MIDCMRRFIFGSVSQAGVRFVAMTNTRMTIIVILGIDKAYTVSDRGRKIHKVENNFTTERHLKKEKLDKAFLARTVRQELGQNLYFHL